jgi:8-oxo-dGTP pyrophosphatase MutT (NUDIX family)
LSKTNDTLSSDFFRYSLRREVKEEIGLDVEASFPQTKQNQLIDLFYLCTINPTNQKVSISPEHS